MSGVSLSRAAFYVRAIARRGLCFESNDDLSTELTTLGQGSCCPGRSYTRLVVGEHNQRRLLNERE
jgi:hypothetical protein